MDIRKIVEIELYNETKELSVKIGKNQVYRLLDISGIDTGEVEVVTQGNLAYPGSYPIVRNIHERNIVIEAEYKGSGDKNLERRFLANFFSVFDDIWVYITLGTSKYKIKTIVEKPNIPFENIHRPLRFRTSFVAPSPFFLDSEDYSTHFMKISPSLHFPLAIPKGRGLVFGKGSLETNSTIKYEGDIDTGVIINLMARDNVNSMTVVNHTTGKRINIIEPFKPGQGIVIDTNIDSRSVRLVNWKGQVNGYPFLSVDSDHDLGLVWGYNNMEVIVDPVNANVEVEIMYQNKYLGV